MLSKQFNQQLGVIHAVLPLARRTGSEYTYVFNGSRLRDILVDGKWLTVAVSAPTAQPSPAVTCQ